MIFKETPLAGAYVIDIEPRGDSRGFFARAFCQSEFETAGIPAPNFVQANISRSATAGTLRGLHYQSAPHEEGKLVRCTHGRLFDVIIDVRPESATYRQWFGIELSRENCRLVWVPAGFAHGFLTLEDDTEIFYNVTASYAPEHEGTVRWDDPAVGITWPTTPTVISDKDRTIPNLDTL